MLKKYILLETEDNNASFIMNERYYEIYFLNKSFDEKKTDIIVSAINQFDAFKLFRKNYPELYIRSTKDFYECQLWI